MTNVFIETLNTLIHISKKVLIIPRFSSNIIKTFIAIQRGH